MQSQRSTCLSSSSLLSTFSMCVDACNLGQHHSVAELSSTFSCTKQTCSELHSSWQVSEDECLAYHDGHELVGLNLHVSVHVRVAERRWLGSGEVPARASCCRLGHLTVLSVWCCWAELHRP